MTSAGATVEPINPPVPPSPSPDDQDGLGMWTIIGLILLGLFLLLILVGIVLRCLALGKERNDTEDLSPEELD